MNTIAWMRRNRVRLIIFSLALLLLVTACKGWFGVVQTNSVEGTEDLNAIRSYDSVVFSEFNLSNSQDSNSSLMKRFCQQVGRPTKYAIPAGILVNRNSKIIYCVNPKCASRQLRRLVIPGKRSKEKNLRNFSKHEQNVMLKTYFKFTFVREPFERLLSAYKDKFVYTREMDRELLEYHGREILKNFRPNASQRALEELNDITFREFIEYIVKKGSDRQTPVMDRHWGNYMNHCGMCHIDYHFIGHYETMEQDLAYFIKAARLSVQDARRFAAYKHTPSNTSSSLLKYYSQIPLEWIDILGRIYKPSFEMFGYNFPGPLKSLYENNTVT